MTDKVQVEVEVLPRGRVTITVDMGALQQRVIERVIERAQDGDVHAVQWLHERGLRLFLTDGIITVRDTPDRPSPRPEPPEPPELTNLLRQRAKGRRAGDEVQGLAGAASDAAALPDPQGPARRSDPTQ